MNKNLVKPTLDKTALFLVSLMLLISGCKTPQEYRQEADNVAGKIINETRNTLPVTHSEISIERPSSIFRRKLIQDQKLDISSNESLGSDALDVVKYWPEPKSTETDPNFLSSQYANEVKLNFIQTLQIGSENSFEYQSKKESIFQKALALDLRMNEFRSNFFGQLRSNYQNNNSGNRSVTEITNSAELEFNKQFTNGMDISSAIGFDLANLISGNGSSNYGFTWQSYISIPLLRGSGEHIVTEGLTQAQREVIYALLEFERYKKTYAVQIASEYLSVLQRIDEIKNSEENYKSLIYSGRRSRKLADAGRLKEIEVDQALQNELRARRTWISAQESYKRSLDSFKVLLGLPPDAKITLDSKDLEVLVTPVTKTMKKMKEAVTEQEPESIPDEDAPIILKDVDMSDAGPLELNYNDALKLAFDNRLDLFVAKGRVFDAQRQVIIAADQLRAELTLGGSANFNGSEGDTSLDLTKGDFAALLTLDLPLERTKERNAYRNSYIGLEQEIRDYQKLEDSLKLDIRNQLRDLLLARENLYIQSKSVILAQKRVKSTTMFLEAGRTEIRDLLDAQEDLLNAQNGLTSAAVDYRVAELRIQRDMGLLQVDDKGIWKEYTPETN